MTSESVNRVPYPFKFEQGWSSQAGKDGQVNMTLSNSKGRTPSLQASRLRSMVLEAQAHPAKTVATCISYDGLSSRLTEEAGFPIIFLAGYAMASTLGIPDTGYIAMQDVCNKIQETARQVSVPIIADGDTGYGSPMNVKRTVQCFAEAGAAGVMIEDQTWPKRCGHTKGKAVVPRAEAFARIQAACDARDEGKDIWILARTDALILGWEETMARVTEFQRIGVDAVFIEAIPDKAAMQRCVQEVQVPQMVNIIEGGLTENLSAKELAKMGFALTAWPWTLVAAHLNAIRETLENLKESMTVGAPPTILSYSEVCKGAGFNRYWVSNNTFLPWRKNHMLTSAKDEEERYKFEKFEKPSAVNGVNGTH
ncbi:uncharacterized protein LTR77_000935 [Saxophila tyrrhenica]|uniref:Isocitrate lyase n=1 Tax=Saxophila tyrrhenica TaxID=1690608 RepID=A0AAV9PSQ8_9PEZI|nr:hypothetical protein LTR77_000935 [Saxophila tyrrhenica]